MEEIGFIGLLSELMENKLFNSDNRKVMHEQKTGRVETTLVRERTKPDAEYISFCKRYCQPGCKYKTTLIFIFGDCFFNINRGCQHEEHPDNELIKKTSRFMAADKKARAEVGLENKPGSYEFRCPNCRKKCVGRWISRDGALHGGAECTTCGVGIGDIYDSM